MKKICLACHSGSWVNGQFKRFERVIETSNALTLAATKLMEQAWQTGLANPKDGLFNQPFERRWMEQWLFFASSTRYASAMMGADFGVFDNGRYYLRKNLAEMRELLKNRK